MAVVLAPAEVLAGLIAVCVLLCAVLIANILKAVLNSVNLFGILSPLIGAADWLANNALSAMSWLWAKTNPVAVWIALVNVWHSTENGLLAVVGGDVLNALQRIVSVAIPNAAHWAVATAEAAFAPFEAGVNGFIAGVLGFITWAHAQLAGLWQAVTVDIPGALHTAVAYVEGEIGAVWGRAQALVGAAVAGLRAELAVAVNALRTEVLGRVITVEQEIAVEIPKVEAEIGQIATVAIPALTVAIEAVRESWDTWRNDCGNPLCNGLNLLKGLETLLEGGALFALIAEAAHDPVATAHEVEAVVTAVIEAPAAAIRDLAA